MEELALVVAEVSLSIQALHQDDPLVVDPGCLAFALDLANKNLVLL